MGALIFIIALILFVLLVVVHELGHAIAAKKSGVDVEEFGIGFPPRAWGKKLKNGVLFSLNWLPLGGFVKLKGEHDSAKGPGTYGGATLKNKAKILMAGVAINWLVAIVIFTILALVGMPKLIDNQFTIASDTKVVQNNVTVGLVGEDSPAERSGLQEGDTLISLDNQRVDSDQQVTEITTANQGKTIDIEYQRDGQTQITSAVLNDAEKAKQEGSLGVAPVQRTIQRSTWSAPITGVGMTIQLTGLTFQGLGTALGNLFVGLVQVINPNGEIREEGRGNIEEAGDSVSGPLGIFMILRSVSGESVLLMLYLIAVISLTLAVMNALPIPALDGGRLFVTLLYKWRGKILTKETEEKIHGYGFMALMIFVALITFVDVRRFF